MQFAKLLTALCLTVAATFSMAAERKAEWAFDTGQGTSIQDAVGSADGRTAAQWATGSFGTGVYFSESPAETITIPDSDAPSWLSSPRASTADCWPKTPFQAPSGPSTSTTRAASCSP
jgi:hypothetical protein